MTSMAAHPFIRGEKLHGIRFEPNHTRNYGSANSEVIEAEPNNDNDAESEYALSLTTKPRIGKALYAGAAVIVLTAVAGLGAMTYAGSLIQEGKVNAPVAQAEAGIQLAAGPKIIDNQIPADYPGIYPGEQKVIYHLAPLPEEQTVEEIDGKGCRWLRVVGKTSGIMAYPKIGNDDQQECVDKKHAVVPLQARMMRDTLPQVAGSTLRIIDIIDSKSGASTIARAVPPLESLIGMGGPDVEVATLSDIPSQRGSSRPAAISTASDTPQVATARTVSRPVTTQQNPGRRQPVSTTAGNWRGEQLEPVRRAAPYVPPENDVMVPITGSGNLQPIRPGEGTQTTRPNTSATPSGSPLQGYAPITGDQ